MAERMETSCNKSKNGVMTDFRRQQPGPSSHTYANEDEPTLELFPESDEIIFKDYSNDNVLNKTWNNNPETEETGGETSGYTPGPTANLSSDFQVGKEPSISKSDLFKVDIPTQEVFKSDLDFSPRVTRSAARLSQSRLDRSISPPKPLARPLQRAKSVDQFKLKSPIFSTVNLEKQLSFNFTDSAEFFDCSSQANDPDYSPTIGNKR